MRTARPDNLLRIELIEDLRHRRSFALKLALPVILVLPLTIKSIPETVRIAGLPLIVLFLGVLGSSVGLTRLKEAGILERLAMLPLSRGRMIRQYLLANAAMDGVQMIAPSAILIISLGLHLDAIALVVAATVMSIFLANCLGVLVSAASGGSGEVHLFSALCVLGIAGLSGLFSGTVPGPVAGALPFGLISKGLSGTGFSEVAVGALVAFHVTIFLIAGTARASGRAFRAK